MSLVEGDRNETVTTVEQQIEHLQTLTEFKAKIIEAIQERDRAVEEVQKLTTALKQEQTNHADTRKSLTNALADAVDILAKAKVTKQEKLETIPDSQLKTEINHQNQTQIQLEDSKSPNTPQLPSNEKLLPRLPSSRANS